MGSRKVFALMQHLMRCGTNATESQEIIEAIVMENLRLGSWEMDDHEGYSATEYIQQHRISQFDVGPLNSVFIRKFFNIHMGNYGGNYKDLDQADVPFQDDVL